MLKKIGSFLIGFVAVFIIGLFSILLAVRMFFSPASMAKVGKVMLEEEINWNDEGFEYLDKDLLIDEMGKFMSDYFRYVGGAPGAAKPTTEGFIKVIDEMVEKYEEENNVEVADDNDIQELYDELEYSLDDLVNEPIDEDVKLVFGIVYSQPLFIGLIVAFIGCILLNYLLRKDWFIIMKHTGITFLFNAIIFVACGLLVNSVIEAELEDAADMALASAFSSNFFTVGIVSLVSAVVLIILSIVLKKNSNDFDKNLNNNMMNSNMNNSNINNM